MRVTRIWGQQNAPRGGSDASKLFLFTCAAFCGAALKPSTLHLGHGYRGKQVVERSFCSFVDLTWAACCACELAARVQSREASRRFFGDN